MTHSDDSSKVAQASGARATVDRRGFLRGLGLTAAAAPAAALGLAAQPAAAAAPQTADASGYQETEHVRRAYETARF